MSSAISLLYSSWDSPESVRSVLMIPCPQKKVADPAGRKYISLYGCDQLLQRKGVRMEELYDSHRNLQMQRVQCTISNVQYSVPNKIQVIVKKDLAFEGS